MFAYCNNNPISYSDPNGHSIVLACILIGAIVGAITGGCIGAYVSHELTGEVDALAVIGGAVGGATLGGLTGWGVGAAITTLSASAAAAASGTIAQAGTALYANWQEAEAGLRNNIGSGQSTLQHAYGQQGGRCIQFSDRTYCRGKIWIPGILFIYSIGSCQGCVVVTIRPS